MTGISGSTCMSHTAGRGESKPQEYATGVHYICLVYFIIFIETISSNAQYSGNVAQGTGGGPDNQEARARQSRFTRKCLQEMSTAGKTPALEKSGLL